MVNILLYVAEQCKIYYPPSEIGTMLNTFLPLLTRDVCPFTSNIGSELNLRNTWIQTYLIIVHVMASFLPLKQSHLYVPFLYKLWESLNSHVSNLQTARNLLFDNLELRLLMSECSKSWAISL